MENCAYCGKELKVLQFYDGIEVCANCRVSIHDSDRIMEQPPKLSSQEDESPPNVDQQIVNGLFEKMLEYKNKVSFLESLLKQSKKSESKLLKQKEKTDSKKRFKQLKKELKKSGKKFIMRF